MCDVAELAVIGKVKELFPSPQSIIDVGGVNINGSPRGFFPDCAEYISVDMAAGPGVDVVMNAHMLASYFGEDRFDLAICLSMLEHDENPLATVAAVRAVVKPGGHLLISVPPPWRPQHDCPSDYFRFMPPFITDIVFKNWALVYNGADTTGQIIAIGQKPFAEVRG